MPERKTDAPLRLPISGIYKIKGVGDVLAGRVEQGLVKPGDEVIFLPTHTTANPCVGKVFTVEMHHKRVEKAGPGDNVGMNIKGLDKGNMPRTGARAGGAGRAGAGLLRAGLLRAGARAQRGMGFIRGTPAQCIAAQHGVPGALQRAPGAGWAAAGQAAQRRCSGRRLQRQQHSRLAQRRSRCRCSSESRSARGADQPAPASPPPLPPPPPQAMS